MKRRHPQNGVIPTFRRMQGHAAGKVIYIVSEHACLHKIFSGLIQPISSRVECETHHLLPRAVGTLAFKS